MEEVWEIAPSKKGPIFSDQTKQEYATCSDRFKDEEGLKDKLFAKDRKAS